MDRAQRKAVHDMANRLRVISKSSGLVSLLSSKLLGGSYRISRDPPFPSISHAFRIMGCPPRLGVVRIIWERKGRKKRENLWKVESRIVLVSRYLSRSSSLFAEYSWERSIRMISSYIHTPLLPQGRNHVSSFDHFPIFASVFRCSGTSLTRHRSICSSVFLPFPLPAPSCTNSAHKEERDVRERRKGEIYGQAKGEWEREGEGREGNRKGEKKLEVGRRKRKEIRREKREVDVRERGLGKRRRSFVCYWEKRNIPEISPSSLIRRWLQAETSAFPPVRYAKLSNHREFEAHIM